MNTTHVKLSPAVLLTFVLLLCNLSAIARPQEKNKKKEKNVSLFHVKQPEVLRGGQGSRQEKETSRRG